MVLVQIYVLGCALEGGWFHWWLARRDELPILTLAALVALATLTHSVDAEQIFSRLGIWVIARRRMGLMEENKWSHLSFIAPGDVLHNPDQGLLIIGHRGMWNNVLVPEGIAPLLVITAGRSGHTVNLRDPGPPYPTQSHPKVR